MYANPLSKGSVINRFRRLQISALEVDTDQHVNVMMSSDGVIHLCSGLPGGRC